MFLQKSISATHKSLQHSPAKNIKTHISSTVLDQPVLKSSISSAQSLYSPGGRIRVGARFAQQKSKSCEATHTRSVFHDEVSSHFAQAATNYTKTCTSNQLEKSKMRTIGHHSSHPYCTHKTPLPLFYINIEQTYPCTSWILLPQSGGEKLLGFCPCLHERNTKSFSPKIH